jgi:hypothetical protein
MAAQQAQERGGEEERGTAKDRHNPLIISDRKGHPRGRRFLGTRQFQDASTRKHSRRQACLPLLIRFRGTKSDLEECIGLKATLKPRVTCPDRRRFGRAARGLF